MKQYIFTTSLLFCSLFLLAQDTEKKHLLKADTTWTQEIFTFPIGFAQEIPLEGYEEAIFPPGWSKEESPDFWSYIFAWDVKAEAPLTTTHFETYLEYYFDGLMNIRDLKNGETILPTNALFIKSQESENTSYFTGKIRLYEGRYTKEMMILHVLATQYYCKTEKKTVVVFRFSPKEFGNPIWDVMNAIPLVAAACKF
ncbi:hypothetical protein [Rasiella sp. SM2506]|uniref:hypothetical protein n=1 Tax=Rasiella sp. SM2506 TaxID=3423914 RepID=UPI003D7A9AC8